MEEYKQELSIKNPNVEIIGDYIDANTKSVHHCLKHDVNWETTPSRALQGVGCPLCRTEKFKKNRTRSDAQYISELKEVTNSIIPLEHYSNVTTSILHKCLKHNIEWKAFPYNVLKGHGCPLCGNEKVGNANKITHEEFEKRVYNLNPNVIILGEYQNMYTHIWFKCKKDEYEWCTTPANFLARPSCPKCDNRPVVRNQEMYIKELAKTNPDIELIGTYINMTTPVLHRCKKDGFEWNVIPYSILGGNTGCPKCHQSKGEREIAKWLNAHNISYHTQHKFVDCKNIKELPFDFYLYDYNACIEFQGKQHYESIPFFNGEEGFKKRVKNDNIKKKYCEDNNIPLLCIPYNESIENNLNNFLFI